MLGVEVEDITEPLDQMDREERAVVAQAGIHQQAVLQTQEAVAGAQAARVAVEMVQQADQASWFSNTPTPSPSPTLAVGLLIPPQLLVGLLSQHLLPEPAMSLGVNNGTLRIFR